jgi:DNA-binding CsgD family transcriptional regulator
MGRARECAAVHGLLADPGGGALGIEGPLGMGKTTLLHHAAGAAAGFTVLRCQGFDGEAGLRYAALLDLFRPLGGIAIDGDALGVCLNAGALLRAAAPVLCLVDDAHALDPSSLEVILYVARRAATFGVAMLIATEPGLGLDGVERMELGQLDDETMAALAARHHVRGDEATLARGNPGALLDLAGVGGGVRRGYEVRLAALPEAARRLLLLAAADPEVSPDELIRAGQLSGLDIADLAPAEAVGLVRVDADRVELPPPLLRELVYGQAPIAERRAAHLRLAEACDPHRERLRRAMHLAAATAGPDAALAHELDEAAHHAEPAQASLALERAARLTAEPAQAAQYSLAAARHAWQAGQPGRARTLLQRAAPDADPEALRRSELLLGEMELRSGPAASTLDSLLGTADRFAPRHPPLAVNALMRAAEAACFSGEFGKLAAIAQRAADLRHSHPEGAGPLRDAGPLPDGAGKEDGRHEGVRDAEAAGVELAFEYIAGLAATCQGRHRRAGEALRRVIVLSGQIGDVPSLTLGATAGLLIADDHASYQCAWRAIQAARAAGNIAALPIALELLACAEYWLGRYGAAEATSWEGLRTARASGQQNYAGDHLAMLALLAAIKGERDTSLARLAELAIQPGAGRHNRPKAFSRWALGVLDLLAARPAEALTHLSSIADPGTGTGHVIVQIMATPWLVEAAARANDRPAGGQALVAFDRWAQCTGDPLRRALSARSQALLAPRGSAEADDLFRHAMELHGQGEADFERARTELLYGQELRRSRRSRDAREHLHRAVETFRRLDVPAWAELARGELRAAGDNAEIAPPSPAEALTPQQQQIARLVAGGATNREVAAQLFLSPRTVDHHLRNIYTRLGIRSRVELTNVLD